MASRAEIIVPTVGAFAGAFIGAVASLLTPMVSNKLDSEEKKRELRAMACETHIHFSLPSLIASSKTRPNQDLIVPRIKISDVDLIKKENFRGVSQQVVSDIAPYHDAALQMAKVEEGERDFENTNYVAFSSDNSKYGDARKAITQLDDVSVKLAKDNTSSHMFRGRPNYCDESAEP